MVAFTIFFLKSFSFFLERSCFQCIWFSPYSYSRRMVDLFWSIVTDMYVTGGKESFVLF